MTIRGAGIAGFGALLVLLGWRTGWPELTVLGAGGVSLVVLVAAWAAPTPPGQVRLDRQSLRVMRGEAAQVRLSVSCGRRRRWLRITEGSPRQPRRSFGVPRRDSPYGESLRLPLDTTQRGRHAIGPYSVVYGDPWSIVRRVLSSADGGVVTVLPRVHPLGRSVLGGITVDESELSSRRAGDQHFHALRDYVLGDEPKMIHWRSTARAGRLVVRQQVAAATNGTAIILDCERTAYGSDEKFGAGWVTDRFETAVELAASLSAAEVGGDEPVHLLTSARGHVTLSASSRSPGQLLDALALVDAVAPIDTVPISLPERLRRTRSARAILVTGTPSSSVIDATRRIRRSGTSVLVIRVGSRSRAPLPGLRTIDVDRLEELV